MFVECIKSRCGFEFSAHFLSLQALRVCDIRLAEVDCSQVEEDEEEPDGRLPSQGGKIPKFFEPKVLRTPRCSELDGSCKFSALKHIASRSEQSW